MSTFSKAIPSALKELRFHFCQSSPSSAGLRQYVNSGYSALKTAHPELKVLIREASAVSPRVFARFEKGVESQISMVDLSEKEIAKQLEALVKSEGKPF